MVGDARGRPLVFNLTPGEVATATGTLSDPPAATPA